MHAATRTHARCSVSKLRKGVILVRGAKPLPRPAIRSPVKQCVMGPQPFMADQLIELLIDAPGQQQIIQHSPQLQQLGGHVLQSAAPPELGLGQLQGWAGGSRLPT